jgi:hypothetical protein
MPSPSRALALALLCASAPHAARACTYSEQAGTAVACTIAPTAGTAANAEDTPGGVVNLGGSGLPSVFAVLSDWGGAAGADTTPGQVQASKNMNAVCDANTCKAVLSAGGNFLPTGLPGARARTQLHANCVRSKPSVPQSR